MNNETIVAGEQFLDDSRKRRSDVIEKKLIPAARASANVLLDLGHKSSADAVFRVLEEIYQIDQMLSATDVSSFDVLIALGELRQRKLLKAS